MILQWLLLSIYLIVNLVPVKCDLPIHAVTSDVRGLWLFDLTDLSETAQSCGSAAPNKNLDNLEQNADEWVKIRKGAAGEKRTLYLCDTLIPVSETPFSLDSYIDSPGGWGSPQDGGREEWRLLPVYETKDDKAAEKLQSSCEIGETSKVVGYWTMLFDEGFEVVLPPVGNRNNLTTRLMAYLRYSRVNTAECIGQEAENGDTIEPDGSTPCYVTDPDRSLIGWVTQKNPHADLWGCFVAEKIQRLKHTPKMHITKATVMAVQNSPDDNQFGLRRYKKTSRMLHGPRPIYTSPPVASFLQMEGTNGRRHTGLYACTSPNHKSSKNSEFPVSFSWGDPFTLSDFSPLDANIINQGQCGSCYATAATYVLQKRAEILLTRLMPDMKEKLQSLFDGENGLSTQAVLDCSFYNQGCEGGLPYAVGRWAVDFGIPSIKCAKYQGVAQQCGMDEVTRIVPKSSSKNFKAKLPKQAILSPQQAVFEKQDGSVDNEMCNAKYRVYGKAYGYVGGCYECCSEDRMMNEIYHNGPVVIAIDAPKQMFSYSGGIFGVLQPSHHRVCDDPEKGLNGWEFTSHALVAVGWGEDPDGSRYWIARNSWGYRWGKAGYMKLLRGSNIDAIEAQGVYIDADPERGILKTILDTYNANRLG